MSLDFHGGGVPPGRIVLIRHGETDWSRSGGTPVEPTSRSPRRASAGRRRCAPPYVTTASSWLPPARARGRSAPRTLPVCAQRPQRPPWPCSRPERRARARRTPRTPPTRRSRPRDLAGALRVGLWRSGGPHHAADPEDQPDWTIWTGRVPGGGERRRGGGARRRRAGPRPAAAARRRRRARRPRPLLADADRALAGSGAGARRVVPAGAGGIFGPHTQRETRVLGGLNVRPAGHRRRLQISSPS